MKLTIEINLNDLDSETLSSILAELCERLPEDLDRPTNGQVLMHDEAAKYIGFAEIK